MKCTFDKEQLAVLIGTLLGDGSLEFNGYKGTRLQIKQSEERKEYVLWLYDHFKDITKTPPKKRPDTKQWYFGTRFYENLTELRKIFYPDGKKRVPRTIDNLLTSSQSLAVWFMDDGRLDYREKYHYSYSFSTDSFTIEGVKRLQNVLKERFDVDANVHMTSYRGKRYPQLYIGKAGRDSFYRIISPHILKCFSYKLPPNITT